MSSSRTDGIAPGLAQIVVSELSCAALGNIWKVTPDVLSDGDGEDCAVLLTPDLASSGMPDINVVVHANGDIYDMDYI